MHSVQARRRFTAGVKGGRGRGVIRVLVDQ